MALYVRTYTLNSTKKLPPVAAGLLIVAGAALLALGLTLLAGFVLVAATAGVGVLAYRGLRGRIGRALGRDAPVQRDAALDPANEVFPPAITARSASATIVEPGSDK